MPDTLRHQAEHDIASLQSFMDTFSQRFPWMTDDMRAQLTQFGDLELPTRYDSPLKFRTLEGLISRIREAAGSLGLKTEEFPHYSCIPTGLVNAMAVQLHCATRSFLLFDSELFLFCHLYAKAFANCLPIVERGEMISLSVDTDLVRERLLGNPELIKRVIDLLYTYAATGSPSKTKQYDPEESYIHLIDILRDGMELFVVAHEFGHIYAGHLSELLLRLKMSPGGVDYGNPSHRQEHEADLLGLLLTLQAMGLRGYDAGLAYVGVELFFVSLDMSARARHALHHDAEEVYVEASSESHPSNSDRRNVLREALGGFIESEEQLKSARELSSNYVRIANLLWHMVSEANLTR